jgi:hypothetical protein
MSAAPGKDADVSADPNWALQRSGRGRGVPGKCARKGQAGAISAMICAASANNAFRTQAASGVREFDMLTKAGHECAHS